MNVPGMVIHVDLVMWFCTVYRWVGESRGVLTSYTSIFHQLINKTVVWRAWAALGIE